tara:strand:+ start:135 stop:1646 length:1512 start_codon:yes stop_codon:yes gene_type:complete
MGIFSKITSTFLSKRLKTFTKSKKRAVQDQADLLNNLLEKGSLTDYGRCYNFNKIRDYDSFSKQVPLVEYEDFSVEIKKVLRGEKNVIWPDVIKWVAMSSGTTNDKSKFIPVSDISLNKNHFKSGQDLLAQYVFNNKKSNLFDGYSLVLGGSRQVTPYSPNPQIYTGDISAVLLKNLPVWARAFRTPSIEVALNPEWEEKIKQMAKITSRQNITSISGVPTWTLVLIKEILKTTKAKNILEVWPNLELFIHGAVSFDPYRQLFKELIPSKNMNYLETYNASEGFFAFQDRSDSEGLLLMTNHGVYYEFEDLSNRTIVSLENVKIGKQYALIISTYSGLWRYKVGDTVTFISLDPYKILITGRTKQFINAFGEELIVQNTDKAISNACLETKSLFYNYTAAPLYISSKSRGAHEWIIEFIKEPDNKKHFINTLDKELMQLNSDYEAKRYRDIAIKPPKIHFVKSGFFDYWLKSKKKLGGQHKVPRLSNDRKYVDDMLDKISNFQ